MPQKAGYRDKETSNKAWITREMFNITDTNCHTLLAKENITQHQMALDTEFADAAVSNFVNCKTSGHFPSISFLIALKENYGIKIEDFITRELAPSQITPDADRSVFEKKELAVYQKYCGAFYCYYFDSSKYKGRDNNSDEESLLYGIIFICRDSAAQNTLEHSCIAILDFRSPEAVHRAMEDLSPRFDAENISSFGNFLDNSQIYSPNCYYGDFELNNSNAFLSLKHKDKDRALIILHRVPSRKDRFAGGIGTINSVCRGREPMPTVQFIGLSRELLLLPAEEIHHSLQLNYPSFKTRDSAKVLLAKFKDLYLTEDSPYHSFSDFDKELVITGNIDSILKDLLKKNLFRYGKISNNDDDDWYHFIEAYSSEHGQHNNIQEDEKGVTDHDDTGGNN